MFRYNAHQYLVFRAIKLWRTWPNNVKLMLRRLDWCPGRLVRFRKLCFCDTVRTTTQWHSIYRYISIVYHIHPYTRLLLWTLVQLHPHNNSKEKTWPGRGQSFSPSRCRCHQRTHPKRTSILRVCEPDGGASPLVWSHKIPEAVSTRTWRDRTVNTNASRLGPFDQLSSHFSHTFCRLTVRSPMNYRQTADGCSLKIRQGSSAQFGSQQIDWTLSQSFLSHGP